MPLARDETAVAGSPAAPADCDNPNTPVAHSNITDSAAIALCIKARDVIFQAPAM
jgi:hypothetical protein